MKTRVYLIAAMIGMGIIACNQNKEKTAAQMLEDPITENEIYAGILSDSVRLARFMDKMMMDDHYTMKRLCMSDKLDNMMKNDEEVVESISRRLINLMDSDETVCDKTCTRMMESDHLKKYFEDHLVKKSAAVKK